MQKHHSDWRAALKLYRQTFLSIDMGNVELTSTTLLVRQHPKNPHDLRIPWLNTPSIVLDVSMAKGNRTRMSGPFITKHVK